MAIEFSHLNTKDILRISRLSATSIQGVDTSQPAYAGFVSLDLCSGNVDSWLEERQPQPDPSEVKLLESSVKFKAACNSPRDPFDQEPRCRKATILVEKITRSVLEQDPNRKLVDYIHTTDDLVCEKPWKGDVYYPTEALAEVAIGLGTQLVRFANVIDSKKIKLPQGHMELLHRGIALPLSLTFDEAYLRLIAFSGGVDKDKVFKWAIGSSVLPSINNLL